eukprot:1461965-Pyramimonas_sp.AAC.1
MRLSNVHHSALSIHPIALNVHHSGLSIHHIALNVHNVALSIHPIGGWNAFLVGLSESVFARLVAGFGGGLTDPKLVEMARKYNRTPAQILIRWCVETECVVIPKSSQKVRIRVRPHFW